MKRKIVFFMLVGVLLFVICLFAYVYYKMHNPNAQRELWENRIHDSIKERNDSISKAKQHAPDASSINRAAK